MNQYRRSPVDQSSPSVGPAGWAVLDRVLNLSFGILQALLGLRIVLLALGADRANWIVAAILATTGPFVEPFRGIFRLDHIAAGSGSVIDFGAVVALIGWTLIEGLVLALVQLADRHTYPDS
jgi:YGGT family